LEHGWSTKTRITNKRQVKVAMSLVCLTGIERTKCPENTKIGRKVIHPTGNNAHQYQGQKVKGQGHQENFLTQRG